MRQLEVVVSSEDGSPLADVEVRVVEVYETSQPKVDDAGLTGADGRVFLRRPFNETTVVARKRGFVTEMSPAQFLEKLVKIRLRSGRPLAGRVVRSDTGDGVTDAEVYVWGDDNEVDLDPARIGREDATGLRTDAAGRFEIAGLPAGQAVVVQARAPGLATVVRRVTAADAPETLTLEIGRGAAIAGVVRNPDGSAEAGVDVYAVPRGDYHGTGWPERRGSDNLYSHAVSGTDGAFRIVGLATPAAYVACAMRDYWTRGTSESVELRSASDRGRREVTLVGTAELSYHIVSPEVRPSLPATERLWTLRSGGVRTPIPLSGRGTNNGGATWDLGHFPPGEYVLDVTCSGWATTHVPFRLSTGEASDVEVRLVRGASLDGFVVDSNGVGVASVRVSACLHRATTDASGRFRIEGVDPGPFVVTAAHPEGRFTSVRIEDVRPTDGPLTVRMTRGPDVVFSCDVSDDDDTSSVWTVVALGRDWDRQGVPSRRGPDGRFHLSAVPVGEPFDVTFVHAKSAFAVRRGLVVRAGEALDLGDIRFNPKRSARGVVLSSDGRPVAGALVRSVDIGVKGESTTDASGAFELKGLPATDVLVKVSVDGAPLIFRLLSCDEPERVQELRLDAGIVVEGAASDAARRPVCGALVTFRRVDEPQVSVRARDRYETTDSLGAFRVLLPAGRYELLLPRIEESGSPSRSERDDRPAAVFDVAAPGPVHVEARGR